MEILGLFSIPTWLLFILAVLSVVYLYMTWTRKTFEHLGIPGPRSGFTGALKEYRKIGMAKFDMDMVEKYGKVVGIFHAREPIMLIADPEMVKQICVREFSNFTNRKNVLPIDKLFRAGVSKAEDDHWKFIRSILSPTFSSGKMRQIVDLIQKAEDNMVANIRCQMKEKDRVEMKGLFQSFTMDVIASTGFGLNLDSQNTPHDPFIKHAKKIMVGRVSIFLTFCFLFPIFKNVLQWFDFTPVPKDSVEFFRAVVEKAIKERSQEKDSSRRDLLQLMLNAHKMSADTEDVDPDTKLDFQAWKKRGLTSDEIMANSVLFILAAYETTSVALTFAAHALTVNPDCQLKLLKEIQENLGTDKPTYDNVWKLPYLDNVVSETLRMYSPAGRVSRVATRDIVINGVKIPRGMNVSFATYALHYDPQIWPNPNKFDPDRFLPENRKHRHPYSYLPFGHGPRNCIGQRLALLETKMTLVTLLQNFRLVPGPDTENPVKLGKPTGMKPAGDVFLRLEERV